MRVFVTGATGVLGRSAVPRLVEAGHDVTGVCRTDAKAEELRRFGATPRAVSLFDPPAMRDAVEGHDVVCHLASRIPATLRGAFRPAWRENERIWGEAAGILVDVALDAGVSTYVHQSSGFMYADGDDGWLDEDSPIDPPPHGAVVVDGEAQATRFASGGGVGISLRFGFFYGPDAGTTRDQLRIARLHVSPFPGKPEGFYPTIHTDDLGTATAAALRAPSGVYNVTDDEPLRRRELTEVVAKALGSKSLRTAPMPLRRFDYIARSQRVSNKRLKETAGWAPLHRSAREGWPATIAAMKDGA